jgi:hypothetical protein
VVSAKQPKAGELRPTLCLVDAAGKVHTAAAGGSVLAGAAAVGEQVIDAYVDIDADVAPGPATLYLIWCAQCDEGATATMLDAARRGQSLDGTVQTIEIMIGEGTP